MNQLQPLWELAQEDPLVRWTAIAGVAFLWLSAAWISPAPMLVWGAVAGGAYLYRRRNPLEPRDEELDLM
jgi:hypothetical protein